jgi:hypothetical protein
MPQVGVSDKLYEKLQAFKPVLEAVIEDEVTFDTCIEVVVGPGLDTMLSDLIGNVEPEVLVASFQQLAAQHPEAVYGFVAETLESGGAAIQRQEARRRIGFGPPETS